MSTHLIGSHWFDGEGPDELCATNPSSGADLWRGRSASLAQIEKAFAVAESTFWSWRQTSFEERYAYVQKFCDHLKAHQDELARAISEEAGKPLSEARTEISAMIGKGAISQQMHLQRNATQTNPAVGAASSFTRYKPHGVVVVLGPYNFSGHLANGHIIPALLAGNVVIFKPSELTPRFGQLMVECWQAIGLPAGVLQLVQGGRAVGEGLLQQPALRGVFFTGSSTTGLAIKQSLLHRPEVRVALEMGGNNPLVVWHDSPLQDTLKLVTQSALITAGQRCTCARRLILPDDDFGQNFLQALKEHFQSIQVGYWTDDSEPFYGPVINAPAGRKVLSAQAELAQQGARPLLQCQPLRNNDALLSPGLWDVTGLSVKDEEIFGPLLQVRRVKDFDEALHHANQTAYGLAAGLVSPDAELYQRFFLHVNAGLINWNTPLTGASSAAPFGGIGQSGNFSPSAAFAADYCSYPVASLETPPHP